MKQQILSLCLLLLCVQVAAQDSIQLKEVSVSATRLESNQLRVPMAITSLQSDWIRNGQPQLTLQEALSITPGLLATNADNFAQDLRISIRGFGARSAFGVRGVRLLVDGLPETTTDGQGQLDNIDPGAIEHIEVIRGAAAGLYGNASGGVVSMRTEAPPERPTLTLRSTLGSFGFQQHRLRFGTTFGHWGVTTHLAYTQLQGYRANSRSQGMVFNGKLTYKKNIAILLNYADSPRADDAGALTLTEATQDPRMARAQNVNFAAGENLRQGKLGITGKHDLNPKNQVQWHAFSLFRSFDNRLPVQSSGIVHFDRWFSGAGIALHKQHSFGNQQARLRLQLEAESQRDNRQRYQNNNGEKGALRLDQLEGFDNIGAAVQYELPLGKRWNLQAALRYDWMALRANDRFLSDGDDSGQRTYHNINPLAGITYSLSSGLNIYANFATAFETPTLNELANPNGRGGFNPDLQPQISQSIELGAKGGWVNWHYDIAAYRIRSNNELAAYEIDSQPNRTFYRNAAATQRMGIEANVQIPLYRALRLLLSGTLANYQYIAAPVRSNDGNQLPALPQQYGTVALQFLPEKAWYGVFQGQYASKMFAEDGNTVFVPEVWLWSARTGYRYAGKKCKLELFAGSTNLGNQRYFSNIRSNAAAGRYYEPGAGRMLYAGIQITPLRR